MTTIASAANSTKGFLSARAKVLAIVAVVLVAFYLLAVTPVRTYFQQQAEMRQAQHRYQVLASTNKELEQRATQLQSDAEIKKLARERYELVEPGDKAYAVMNPSPAVIQQPQTAPAARDHGFVAQAQNVIARAFWPSITVVAVAIALACLLVLTARRKFVQ